MGDMQEVMAMLEELMKRPEYGELIELAGKLRRELGNEELGALLRVLVEMNGGNGSRTGSGEGR